MSANSQPDEKPKGKVTLADDNTQYILNCYDQYLDKTYKFGAIKIEDGLRYYKNKSNDSKVKWPEQVSLKMSASYVVDTINSTPGYNIPSSDFSNQKYSFIRRDTAMTENELGYRGDREIDMVILVMCLSSNHTYLKNLEAK